MSTAHLHDLLDLQDRTVPWPFGQVGVFPVAEEPGWWDSFNYTVGLGPVELWASTFSIEDRYAGNELVGYVLNVLAVAWQSGHVTYGDSVIVPLGVPDADDADSVWWFASQPAPASQYQCNMTPADLCVPVRWSSPLGFRPEDDDAAQH